MKEIATLQFVDADSGEEAIAIIRAANGYVALCLSLRHNGDVEILIKAEECEALIEALQRAVPTQ